MTRQDVVTGVRSRLVRATTSSTGWVGLGATVVAVVAALALASLLIVTTGGSPAAALRSLLQGSVSDSASITNTLLYAAPLLLVGVGACVSTRVGIFNIGQEGQVLMGALGGAWFALRLAVTGPVLAVLVVVGGAIGGGVWAGLCALMNRFRGVNVVVSTLLMTFLATQLVSFAVGQPWFLQQSRTGTSSYVAAQSNQIPASARLGSLGEYPSLQINLGLIIALVATVVVAIALSRTRWGFRVKMVGLNPAAARHAGVRTGALGIAALVISGALAGIAGAVLLASPIGTNRLEPTMSNNIGWDGLLVALVARNRPVLCIPVAFLFGILRAGGSFLAATGVPAYLVDVVKGLLVLALVLPSVATDIAKRRRRPGPVPAEPGPVRDKKVEVPA
jgi:ABC-type uncharacterized transport system permease subunit